MCTFIFFKTGSKITLQCCAGFCSTPAWISHACAHSPSPLSLLPLDPDPLLWVITERWAEPPAMQKVPTSCLFSMRPCVCQCWDLGLSHPLLSPLCLQGCLTPVSLFLPCKQVHPCHFSRFHTYALIYDTCFLFLTYFALYNSLKIHPHQCKWLNCIYLLIVLKALLKCHLTFFFFKLLISKDFKNEIKRCRDKKIQGRKEWGRRH